MSGDTEEIRFDAAGEAALWARLPDGAPPGAAFRWAAALEKAPGVHRVDPGPGGLMLLPAPGAALREVKAAARRAYRQVESDPPGAEHELEVSFAPRWAPDLPQVAARAGLDVAEVVRRLVAGRYRVDALGFLPGFPYLLGLDPRLWIPRRPEARTRVPEGSLGIGGRYLGVYPRAAPGGFHLVGRTDRPLFDPGAWPPCPLAPGDSVRLREAR